MLPARLRLARDALDAVRLVADAVSAEIQVRNGVHTAFHPGRVAEVSLNAAGERALVLRVSCTRSFCRN